MGFRLTREENIKRMVKQGILHMVVAERSGTTRKYVFMVRAEMIE